jgi:glycosyltransferase involved in cell wall biosynthesis
MGKKKILFLSCYDQPNGSSTRTFNFAKTFVKFGHDVTMVCNNYSHLTKKKISYKKKITVKSVKVFLIDNFKYSDHGISRIFDMCINFFMILKLFIFKKFDVIISPSVPLTTSLAGLILKLFGSSKFFFEVRDIWPDALVYNKNITRKNLIFWFFKFIEILCYKFSTSIITSLPNVKQYIKKYDNKKKIFYIPNPLEIKNYRRKKIKLNKKKIIVYIGRFSNDHDTDLIVKVANILKDKKKFIFKLYGDGYNKNKTIQLAKKLNLKNIFFYDFVNKSKISNILENASICLAPITDSLAYQWGINLNKIYDYMKAAKPIIFSGNVNNNTVYKSQKKYCYKSGDYKSVAKGILSISALSQNSQLKIGKNNHLYLKRNNDLTILSINYNKIINSYVN